MNGTRLMLPYYDPFLLAQQATPIQIVHLQH